VRSLEEGSNSFCIHSKVHVGVHVAFLAAGELLAWCVMTDPAAPEVASGEYYKRRQAPTIIRDALDCRDQGSLNASASVSLTHLGTYKVLERSKQTEQPMGSRVTCEFTYLKDRLPRV
jgi:hypothetical protein